MGEEMDENGKKEVLWHNCNLQESQNKVKHRIGEASGGPLSQLGTLLHT